MLRPGQCATCRQARVVSTRRGSSFLLCERSRSDEAFARYPALPVSGCVGYDPPGHEAPASPVVDET